MHNLGLFLSHLLRFPRTPADPGHALGPLELSRHISERGRDYLLLDYLVDRCQLHQIVEWLPFVQELPLEVD